jgi:hypothetical protein
MIRASVLIPTHDKHSTIGLAVDTVLRQTVTELEVLLIGDGVTDALRAEIERLLALDKRVRFLDFPKGPHHGERYRHDAILAARSAAIFYLCDDDLLLPEHVSDLLALLEEHNFVQSFNGYCRSDGEIEFFAADLSDAETIELMLDEEWPHNSVSLTGTAHDRRFYEQVGARWDTTPPGREPDHHQWRNLWRHAALRGATSQRMTALQMPTSDSGRHLWTPEERRAELQKWYDVVTAPDGQRQVDALVARAARRVLAAERNQLVRQERLLHVVHDALADTRAEVARLGAELDRLDAERQADAGRTDRLHARLRRRLDAKNAKLAELRSRLRRRSSGPGPPSPSGDA